MLQGKVRGIGGQIMQLVFVICQSTSQGNLSGNILRRRRVLTCQDFLMPYEARNYLTSFYVIACLAMGAIFDDALLRCHILDIVRFLDNDPFLPCHGISSNVSHKAVLAQGEKA